MTEQSTLATTQNYSDVIQETSSKLQALAEAKDEKLKASILELARITQPEIKGVEGEARSFRITELRMRQPMSNADSIPEDCKPGEFFSTDGDTLGDNIRFIPILSHTIRKKWGDDNKIDCVSMDGVSGTRYGKCKECPYGQYEQGVKLECSPGHSFYVVTPDLSALYRVDFQKSSAKAGRNILRLTKPPALWGRSFSLSTAHQTQNNRNYYTLVTKPTGQKVDDDTLEVCELLHKIFHAHYQKALGDLQRFATDPTGATGEGAVKVTEEEGGNIDFSDSM